MRPLECTGLSHQRHLVAARLKQHASETWNCFIWSTVCLEVSITLESMNLSASALIRLPLKPIFGDGSVCCSVRFAWRLRDEDTLHLYHRRAGFPTIDLHRVSSCSIV